MPNRIIKESCRTSKRLDALSDGAERLFWRLITVADDFGIFEAEPIIIKCSCFPRKADQLKTSKVKQWLEELTEFKLITLYQAENGCLYAQFMKWDEHQGRKRAKFSKHPNYQNPNSK